MPIPVLKKYTTFVAGGLAALLSTGALASPVEWTARERVGDRNTGVVGTGDIDGDGIADVAMAINNGFVWFPGPGFDAADERVVGAGSGTSYAGTLVDINADGWPDLVASDGARNAGPGRLWVFLHPGPAALDVPWPRIEVWSEDVWHQNDLEVVDLDGDQRLDIAVRTRADARRVIIALQNDDITDWTVRAWPTGETANAPEGLGAGDVDSDGETELVLSGVYWDNPGGWRTGDPVEYSIDAAFVGKAVKAVVADLDHDGQADDVVMSKAEGSGDIYLAWYRLDGDPSDGAPAWTRTILRDSISAMHSLEVVDVDADGHNDILGGNSFSQNGIYVYYGSLNGALWTEQVLDSGGKFYVASFADLDGDTDLDIVGPATWQGAVYRYMNLLTDDPPPPDDVPPAVPVAPQVVAVSDTQASLTWPPTTDNIGVAGYRVHLDGSPEDVTSQTAFTVTGLDPLTTYSVALSAFDAAGNESAVGPAASLTTTEPPDLAAARVAHYRLDETAGTAAQDDTGLWPGTLRGVPAWQPNGVHGGALSFGGADAAVDIGNVSVEGDGLTLAAWVYLDSVAGIASEARFVSKASGVVDQDHVWMLGAYLDGSALRFRLKTDNGGTATLISAEGVLPMQTWVHAAATYDGATMRLFADGQEVASVAKTGALVPAVDVAAALGNQPEASLPRGLVGRLDDVYVLRTALDSSGLATLMQGIEPGGCADVAADCDGDGVDAGIDNCSDVTNADQTDTDNDGYGNACDADFNNDCVVNVEDLGQLRAAFFTDDPLIDLNGDGVVNAVDLGLLRVGFFLAPGPSAAGDCP